MSDNIKAGQQYVWSSPDGSRDRMDGSVVTVLAAADAWPDMSNESLYMVGVLFPGYVPARFDGLDRPIPVAPSELSAVPE